MIREDEDKKYLISQADGMENRADMKMLLHNKVPGFLPVQLRYLDESSCFYYEIESLISIERILKNENLSNDWLHDFYRSVVAALEKGKEFFLQENHYVFLTNTLYWNTWEKSIGICYCPLVEANIEKQLLSLTEDFLKHLDHSDKNATAFLYGIYELQQQKGFCIQSVKDFIEQSEPEKKSSGNHKENYRYTLLCQGKQLGVPEKIKLNQAEMYLGRMRCNEIIIPYAQISKIHARFIVNKEQLFLVDCESKNGTKLNGKKIPANRMALCKKADIIRFADISYRVEENL